ncbi:MAG TPA: efflux RND transporter periplasmic adaptor subunit [Chloroflexota bacterium]|nr:efflux RND transporter periplasmic adaptor subunit [Chloroflexota bacterium]
MQKRTAGMALSLVPMLALAACGQAAAPQPSGAGKSVITVSETQASTGSIASLLSYSGSVTPRWTVSIMPKAQGTVSELKVQQGQKVNAGDVLAVLDHRSLDDQVAQANANISSAQAKLNSVLAGARPEDVAAAAGQAGAAKAGVSQAQANLDSSKAKLAQAQAGGRAESIGQAQAKLDADQAALNKLLNGPVPLDVTNANLAVEQAKDKLFADQTATDSQVHSGLISKEQRQATLDVDQTAIDQANTSLAKLVGPPRPEDVAQAQAAVNSDKQALDIAKQPNRPEDIAQLQQGVAAAQALVNQAQQTANAQQASAAKAAKPYTPEDIQQAQAAVDVAQANARSAQTALTDATITAPAAGILSDVPVAVGSLVSPQSSIATLISPDLEVDASVEESQVALFKDGQPATISIAAAKPIDGKVLLVAPAADAKTRKFTVKVVPAAASTPLRSGMSATVSIQTGEQQNAVLVPKDAIIQRNGQQVVFLDQNSRAKMVTVQTGLSDTKQVQVLSGIDAGSMVILPGSIDLADGDAIQAASTPPAAAPSSP